MNAQTSDQNMYSAVHGWTGNLSVYVRDTGAFVQTEYIFTGPVTVINEVNNGKNLRWPEFLPTVVSDNPTPKELQDLKKKLDEQVRVWNAQTTVTEKVFNGTDTSDYYTCTSDFKQQLKFSMTISGDTITLDPEVYFSGMLNCAGNQKGHVSETEEFHSLALKDFMLSDRIQNNKDDLSLHGRKSQPFKTGVIVVEWNLRPVE